VHLHLHAHRQPVVEHPARQVSRGEPVRDRREQDRRTRGEIPLANGHGGPLVVGAVGDDELDLVPGSQRIEVRPSVPSALPASGTLHVDDALDPRGHAVDREAPTGLEENFEAARDEGAHQLARVRLEQRLASGHLDERAAERLHPCDDRTDLHVGALVERVRGVAPDAAQVAPRQPDEHAGPPRVGGFPLHRVEDLVDAEHPDILAKGGGKHGRGGP